LRSATPGVILAVLADQPVQARRARPSLIVRLALRFARSCRLGAHAAYRGVIEFYNSSNLTFASSIAYYALLSLFPFVLLMLTLFGRLATGPKAETLVRFILSALPTARHFDFVVTQVAELSKAPPALGVAGTLIMFWGAMGFFGAITSAVNHAWGVDKPHNYFKHKMIAAIMLAVAGLLMVAALSLVSVAEVVETQWFGRIIYYYPEFAKFQTFAIRNAPTPLFILIVGLVCYFLPNAKVRLRDVWWGAILAGILWRLAFWGFSSYVRDLSRFSVHGSISAVVVFLIWVYLSAVILLYGVEVSAAYARLRKHIPEGAPAAAVRET
jgi:membrane protein